ncbi:peptidase M14 [Halobacillus halophilus]|uniref:M14 family zinc carboxypeptidase n=1 Tax=Halobacillus halophilus TaxID=1570 RepID=UPI00136CFCFD|nr:M14 family zinc carboxypeptidase [Halobacillus halophilus]MYL28752.1 peptidase M14 [Halobacillus halophilus]
MKNKKALSAACGAVLLSAGLLTPVPAVSADTNPGTPVNQTYSVEGFISHEELSRTLDRIEKSSQGRVDVHTAGYSNSGREIYTARVGHGEKVILVQSEIHGNEKTGTTALLNMLQQLGSNGSKEIQSILNEVTIVAMPMVNPDASELNRRGNDLSWHEVVEDFPQLNGASPSWNYYTYTNQYWDYKSNPGFDVNRDFNPDLNYEPSPEDFPGASSKPGWYITPEAQTIRDVYQELMDEFGEVDVFIDLHHQGEYFVEGTEDKVTLSLSGNFVPDPASEAGQKYAEYADTYDGEFSKQLNVAAYRALQTRGNSPFDHISLYPQDLDLPGTALGSFALNGSGTVLFEVTGQTQSYGQKKRGQFVKAVEMGIYGILTSVASGEVYEINEEAYGDIPKTER